MFCAGDFQATCGDECAIDLYTSSNEPTELVLPESGFSDIGCYR